MIIINMGSFKFMEGVLLSRRRVVSFKVVFRFLKVDINIIIDINIYKPINYCLVRNGSEDNETAPINATIATANAILIRTDKIL